MTVRSEGQFNTVVYEDYDLYRGQERRDVILAHPDDLARLALPSGTKVCVTSAVGELRNVIARGYDKIKPGNVLMYYPEANALVPRTVDPQSRTPAFKNVLVRITSEQKRVAEARLATPFGNGEQRVEPNGTPSSRGGMRAC
jgi:anaerobic selenocysteine-containing dehydrogenase